MAVSPVVNLYGAVYVGVLISTCLFGFLTLQTYIYFQHPANRTDWWLLKFAVAYLWIVEIIDLFADSQMVYYFLVLKYDQPKTLALNNWTIPLGLLLNSHVTWIVQLFFAWRLWRLSHRHWSVLGVAALAFLQHGAAFAVAVRGFGFRLVSEVLAPQWLIILALASTMACDIAITCGLVYLLRSWKTGFSRTDGIVHSILVFSLTTGLLTTMTAILNIITYQVLEHNLVNVAVHIVLGRLYSNSMLATLNARAFSKTQLISSGGGHTENLGLSELRPSRVLGENTQISSKSIITSPTNTKNTTPIAIYTSQERSVHTDSFQMQKDASFVDY